MIIERKGNLLNITSGLLAHGVNCRYAFNRGIAGQIRAAYRSVYLAYLSKKNWSLGEIQVVDVKECPSLKIANMATQEGYGYGDVYVNYGALQDCFHELLKYCHTNRIGKISIPRIGAGLAGGDWNEIKSRIRLAQTIYPIPITVYYL